MLKELVRASFSGALKNNENNSSFDTMTQGHPEMKLICLDFSGILRGQGIKLIHSAHCYFTRLNLFYPFIEFEFFFVQVTSFEVL